MDKYVLTLKYFQLSRFVCKLPRMFRRHVEKNYQQKISAIYKTYTCCINIGEFPEINLYRILKYINRLVYQT